MERTLLLFDFGRPADVETWQPVDDVVMGGVSSSQLRVTAEGRGLFAGQVSLAHNGGFASVRSQPRRVDLEGYDGLELRVRGDGHRYQMRLRTDPRFDGIAYGASFDTLPGAWQTVRLPFSAFRPTFRGWTVPDAPPLQLDQVYSFGLLISDKQAGPFRLEVDWLQAYAGGTADEPM
jgi:NADH dehydrogenase [ubiquinone] 1 alpha subcomplex assembly factor 1